MATENQIPEGLLLKISKLQELAKRGVEGEAANAQRVLEALCEKYGIELEELDEEVKQVYKFPIRASVVFLFRQCFACMFGASTRFKEDMARYKSSSTKKQWFECKLTPSEYIQFSQYWEWHGANYLHERAKMRKTFESAYIEKHRIYTEIWDEEDRKRDQKKPDMQEVMEILKMASMVSDNTFHKQIGEAEEDEE